MSFIVSKNILKEISSKLHVFTKNHIFICCVSLFLKYIIEQIALNLNTKFQHYQQFNFTESGHWRPPVAQTEIVSIHSAKWPLDATCKIEGHLPFIAAICPGPNILVPPFFVCCRVN